MEGGGWRVEGCAYECMKSMDIMHKYTTPMWCHVEVVSVPVRGIEWERH